MKTAAGADSAATLSQGLKTCKIPARGLIWGCPAPGKSRGQGGCPWFSVPQAEPPWSLLGFGQVPVDTGTLSGGSPWIQEVYPCPAPWLSFVSHGPARLCQRFKSDGEGRKRRRREKKKEADFHSETKSVCLGKQLPAAGRRERGRNPTSILHTLPPASSTCLLQTA